MKTSACCVLLLCLLLSCRESRQFHSHNANQASETRILRLGKLPGNNIVEWGPRCKPTNSKSPCTDFEDPLDDTVNYKRVSQDVFSDTAGKAFVLSQYEDGKYLRTDTSLIVAYFQDVSDAVDLRSYRAISDGYFTTNGKVYLWWSDMQHSYPVLIKGADPNTFKPFEKLAGGKDKSHVFYGGPPESFEIIPGADPRSIRVLNPKRGCWNCGNCYFADDRSVFFGTQRINGADAKSFKLVDRDSVDAQDKNHRYFDGKVVK